MNETMPLQRHSEMLEDLYNRLNRRRYVHPDPLEFLYEYDDPADREVVGLVASSLAYGRVAQILKSVGNVLDLMGRRPVRFLLNTSAASLEQDFAGFRYRFATGENISSMLLGVRRVIDRHGSLGSCLIAGMGQDDETVLPALSAFTKELADVGKCGHLLPDPARGSACKRMNLFLRWMVRADEVDPGGWETVSAAKLIIPLDTHMHRIALTLGATRRNAADMRTAMEVTDAFRRISPDDPVRYDFALTRLGIREEMDFSTLCEKQFCEM